MKSILNKGNPVHWSVIYQRCNRVKIGFLREKVQYWTYSSSLVCTLISLHTVYKEWKKSERGKTRERILCCYKRSITERDTTFLRWYQEHLSWTRSKFEETYSQGTAYCGIQISRRDSLLRFWKWKIPMYKHAWWIIHNILYEGEQNSTCYQSVPQAQ